MSRCLTWNRGLHQGFPRVSGDEPDQGYYQVVTDEFSPRERG